MTWEADTLKAEQAKYRKAWALDAYRVVSPGENHLQLFRRMVRARRGSMLDLGTGTGRAGLALARMGFDVTLADFVDHDECLDEDVRWALTQREVEWMKLNAWGDWPKLRWDWVFCCDMLEHIPPQRIGKVVENVAAHSNNAFFTVCFNEDHFGQHPNIDEPLHLCVRPFNWWLTLLRDTFARVLEARDLIGYGAFRVAS